MSNRETRGLYQKLSTIEIKQGAPAKSEGDEGSMTIRWVSGKGLYIYVKYGAKWYARSLLDKALTVQEELNQTVIVQTVVETERTTTNELDVSNRLSLGSNATLTLPSNSITNSMIENEYIQIGGVNFTLGSNYTALTGLTDIDVASAANYTLFDTIGANTLTLGASDTNVAIGNDLSVGGDFTVSGTSNVSLDSTSLGTLTVQKTSTVALKVGDADLNPTTLTVDTSNNLSLIHI